MRLSTKISIAHLVTAAILAFAMAFSISTTRKTAGAYDHISDTILPALAALEEMRYGALGIVAAAKAGVLGSVSGRMTDPERFDVSVAMFWASFGAFTDHFSRTGHHERGSEEAIRASGRKLETIAREILTDIRFGADPGLASARIRELRDIEARLIREIDARIAEERVELWNEKTAVQRKVRMQILLMALSALIFLGMMGVVGHMTRRTIVRPLERLTAAAEDVARGNYVLPLPHPSRDEIGILSRSFRHMVGQIATLVADGEAGRAALVDSEARFRDFAEAASDWLWETDAAARFTFVSERFADLSGIPISSLVGTPASALVGPETVAAFAGRDMVRNLDCEYRDSAGRTRHSRISGRPLFGPDGAFLGYRGTATDTTDAVEAVRKVAHLALHDVLTGLPNRLLVTETLARALTERNAVGGDVAVIFIDLDRFKAVNDTLGHAAGDTLLAEAARRLEHAVGPRDTVGRLGGDEFVVVQVGAAQPGGAEALCHRILEEIGQPFQVSGTQAQVGASLGVALASSGAGNAEALLREADVAMYRAKEDGRGFYRFHDEAMSRDLLERRETEEALRRAIRDGELSVHYQPLFDARSRVAIGCEALVRWARDDGTRVPPTQFIPLAEETGLIVSLGEMVLRTACRDAAEWPGQFVSVNLSPLEFLNEGLLQRVTGALADAGLPPERLEIEITEGVFFEATETAMFQLDALRDLGVAIVMDDFGTGYSSLGYLKRFRFDKIKLDRSFIAGIETDPMAADIARTVLHLGHALGTATLAEGVETERQAEFLLSEGCDQLQGFLLAEPQPVEEVLKLLRAAAPAEGHAVPVTAPRAD